MKSQDIFIAHPKTAEEVNALKAFMKALNIKFEVTSPSDKGPYNPDFVAKIKKSKEEIEEGNFIRVEKKDLSKFLGLE